MKKTIIMILALLPIVLLVVIAVAGRILSIFEHISVEKVEFVDRIGSAYTDEMTFKVAQGGEKETHIKIYPELATNKKVTYTSANTDICTVDANGVIHGVHYGATTVTVKTQDSAKTAILNVLVTADVPFAVSLSETEKSLLVGGSFKLQETVDAPVSLKAVTWSSSDESVAKVDAAGNVTALSPGEAFITVTTVSGGKTASCKVTVKSDLPPVSFDFEGAENVVYHSTNRYIVSSSSLDLSQYVVFGDGITANDVSLSLDGDIVSLEDWVLTLEPEQSGIVKLTVSVTYPEGTYSVVISFLFDSQ